MAAAPPRPPSGGPLSAHASSSVHGESPTAGGRQATRSMQSVHEYTPPGTLEGAEDEVTSQAGSQAGSQVGSQAGGQPVDSVAALLSWLHTGPPSSQTHEQCKLQTKFLALKHPQWRHPYAREVQLREGCIYTMDPATGDATNQWAFDDAMSARVEVRGEGAVLWLVLPGRWFPFRRRSVLELYMSNEELAERVALQLGFDVG